MNAIFFPDLLAGSTCSVDELKMEYLQNIPYTIFIKFKLNTLARHYVSAHYFTLYILQHVSALIEPFIREIQFKGLYMVYEYSS
jgi:hypothetical protein